MAPDTRELTLATNQRAPHQQTRGKSMDLPKTTAFVSGANRGLGKHLADQFTSRGAGVHGGASKPGTLDTSTGVTPSSWTSPIPAQ